jgi:hypothetical protein
LYTKEAEDAVWLEYSGVKACGDYLLGTVDELHYQVRSIGLLEH